MLAQFVGPVLVRLRLEALEELSLGRAGIDRAGKVDDLNTEIREPVTKLAVEAGVASEPGGLVVDEHLEDACLRVAQDALHDRPLADVGAVGGFALRFVLPRDFQLHRGAVVPSGAELRRERHPVLFALALLAHPRKDGSLLHDSTPASS